MIVLTLLDQIYLVSAGVGTMFLSFSLFMGKVGHGAHGAGHGISHGGSTHAIGHGIGYGAGHGIGSHAIGHGHGIGSGTGHGPGSGQGLGHTTGTGHGHGVGHGTSPSTGHSGHTPNTGHSGTSQDSSAPPSANQNTMGFPKPAGSSISSSARSILSSAELSDLEPSALSRLHLPPEGENSRLELILSLVNPMVISSFLTFFGLAGFCLTLTFRTLGIISLVPATVIGIIVTKLLLMIINWMFTTLQSTSHALIGEIIGQAANVTVPITCDRIGEVTYVIHSKLYNSPARALSPEVTFEKGTRVIISQFRNGIAYVEPWIDNFFPGES
jgi:hypothetical protein